MDRTPQQAAAELNELLANAVTVVDGSTGSGVKVGSSITFRYRDPATNQDKTATGIAWTDCPPGQVTGVRTASGWIVFSPNASKVVRDTLTEYRRRRQTGTTTKFRVGMLYRQRISKTTPMVCYSDDPDKNPPKDPEPPKDPNHPKPDQPYLHHYVSSLVTFYPERLNAWLFSPPNHCGLQYGQPDNLGWLPDFPPDPWYDGVYVSTFSSFDAILHTAPTFDSPTFRNYYQILYHYDPEVGFATPFCSLRGIVVAGLGDTAAPVPSVGYIWNPVYLYWMTIEITPLLGGTGFVAIGNGSAKECAPALPDVPLPNVPPRDPPTAPEATWAIWYRDDLTKTPIKLKEISTKDPVSKGEIVFANNSRRVVILKYGDSRYDGAPVDSIYLGYCRLSVFLIPGEGGADFTEQVFHWDEGDKEIGLITAVSNFLKESGLTWNRFTKILGAHAWFTDDQAGWSDDKQNPLFHQLLQSAEEVQSRSFVSRHLRHLRLKGGGPEVYLIDPSTPPPFGPEDFRGIATSITPPFDCYFGEQVYNTAKLRTVKTEDVEVKIKRFQSIVNPVPPTTESYATPVYILVSKDSQGKPYRLRSLNIPEAQAVLTPSQINGWEIMTIVCSVV